MRGINVELNNVLQAKLKERFSSALQSGELQISDNRGLLVLEVSNDKLLDIVRFLKYDEGFDTLMDLTAVDYLGKRPENERFEVIYLLHSMKSLHRVRIKTKTNAKGGVPSLMSLYKGANWPEREVFDLFGISFAQHPLMERIIMPDNFRGHPLRKDFPLEGIGEDYLIEDLLVPSEKSKMKIGYIDNI